MSTAVIPRRTKKPAATPTSDLATFGDVLARVGGVRPERIRMHPTPGTATVADVSRLLEQHNILCELVDGVLVEKCMGYEESSLAFLLAEFMGPFVRRRNLGLLAGPDGAQEIRIDLVRIPDVSFVSWDRLPERKRPKQAIPRIVPNLVAEILSRSNTRAEMKRKRRECFEAGVELFWEFDPKKRIVRVYTAPEKFTTLDENDTLDGGTVLPGFELPLGEFFAELDRHG